MATNLIKNLFALIVGAAGFFAAVPAQATNYTCSWAIAVGATTTNWSSTAIWSPGVPGSAAGDILYFASGGNNGTVTNDYAQVTIAGMWFGSKPGKNYLLTTDSHNYGFTFNNNAGGAWLANSNGATTDAITIKNPITLADNLFITNYAKASGGFTLSGNISESGGSRSVSIYNPVATNTGGVALSGANTYSGPTIIGSGTLTLGLGGSISSTRQISIAAGATFNVSALTSGFTYTGASPQQTLAGSSSSGVAMISAANKTVTLASGALLSFQAVGGVGTTVGSISVTGALANLTLNTNVVTINVTGSALASGTYRLLDCTGNLTGSVNGTPTIAGTPLTGSTAIISTTAGVGGHVDLIVQAIPQIVKWTGSINNFWDINATANWSDTNGAAITYADGDAVVLDDAGNGGSLILLTNTATVSPASVTFNLTNKSYLISGGAIAGGGLVTLTKNGSGTLTLANTNTYGGNTATTAGELIGVTGGSCSNSPVFVSAGATNGVLVLSTGGQWVCGGLTYNSGNSYADFNFSNSPSGVVAPIQVNGNLTIGGTLNVIVRGNAAFLAGTYPLIKYSGSLSGTPPATPWSLPVGVSATLINNTNNKSIDLNVSVGNSTPIQVSWAVGNGIWDIASTANWKTTNSSPVTYADAEAVVLDDTATGISPITVTLNTVVNPYGVTATNNGKNYVLSGAGSVMGWGGLTKLGTGTLTLSGANTYSGGTTLSAGQLGINNGGSSSANSAIGTGTLTISGGTIANTSGADVTLLPNNTQNWNGSFAYSGSTNNLNLGSGAVNLNATATLTVNSNTLTVGGTIANSGSFNLTKAGAGTLTLSGGSPSSPSAISQLSGNGGTLNLSGYLNTLGSGARFFVAGGTINLSGAVTNTGGYTGIGNGGTADSILNVTGSFYNAPTLGFYISGGSSNTLVPLSTIKVSGGGAVTMANSKAILLGSGVGNGNTGSGSGVLTLTNNGIFDTANGTGLFQLGNNGGAGTINLDGGILATLRSFTPGVNVANPGTSIFNFNGGTLLARGTNMNLMSGLTMANVRNGGAVIDDGGFDIAIGQPLMHSTISGDAATDGGLIKNGAGTLYLDGTNTFNGLTRVTAGTLGGSGTITSSVIVSNGAALAPGDGVYPGTLSINSNLVLNGNLLINLNKSFSQSNDYVMVNGSLTNSGTGLVLVTNLGSSLYVGDKFTLFSRPLVNGSALTISGGGSGVVWSNSLALDGGIQVLAVPSGPPIITSQPQGPLAQFTFQPQSQFVLLGSNATFSVTANDNGATMGFQWFFNGAAIVDGGHFSGSGTPALYISAAITNNTGNYFVVVTNAFGGTTSTVATLTVLVPTANQTTNFIIVFTDDQRWDSLGVLQREEATNGLLQRFPFFTNGTPNMDRLCTEGVRFRNGFCSHSLCSPSRSSILTGMFPHNTGIVANNLEFPTNMPTYASILHAAGYVTALVGKWHMNNQIARPGFDYSASFIGQGGYFDKIFYTNTVYANNNNPQPTPSTTTNWTDDVSTDYALDFINRAYTSNFLLHIGYKTPHAPVQPPDWATNLYTNATSVAVPNTTFPPPYTTNVNGGEPMGTTIAAHQCLTPMDLDLGRLLSQLDALGIASNTMIIYTSDNGKYRGEHSLSDKRVLYDEGWRVPMIVRYPRLPAQPARDEFVMNVDIAPTVLDFAGLPIPPNMQGQSWRPLLTGNSVTNWRSSIFGEYFVDPEYTPDYPWDVCNQFVPAFAAVRTATNKLVVWAGMPQWTELYDLSADIYETNNIFNNSAYQATRNQMLALFNGYMGTNGLQARLSGPSLNNGVFSMNLTSGMGPMYQLESSTDLQTWTPVSLIPMNGFQANAIDYSAGNSNKYYRVSWVYGSWRPDKPGTPGPCAQ